MANVTVAGASYSDVPAVQLPTTGGGTSVFYEVKGSQTITTNGTVDVTTIASVTVSVSGGGTVYDTYYLWRDTNGVVRIATSDPSQETGYAESIIVYAEQSQAAIVGTAVVGTAIVG